MELNRNECLHCGLDPDKVRKIALKVERALEEAQALGLYFFGGAGGDLRFSDAEACSIGSVVCASFELSTEGGDGGTYRDICGVLRGEN